MCYAECGDGADVWRETAQVARKAYLCVKCRLPILPGVRYLKVTCLAEGYWSTMHAHHDCADLSKHIQLVLCKQQVWFLEADETLRFEVREHMSEDRTLLPRYRQVLRARVAEGVWPVRRSAFPSTDRS